MTQLAIDYGPTRLRLLEYEGSGRKVRIMRVTEVDLRVPAVGEGVEADDQRAEAVARAVKEAGLTVDPSAMAFDAGNALFREFDLPFTSEEQVSKVVRFEAESHIPLDINDVVLQHLVLRTTRDRSHILAATVRKDDLLDRLDVLDEANIDPMFVEMDVFALYHALVATGVAAEHEVIVVVNAQESSTSLLFLVGGALYSVRALRLGTHHIAIEDAAAPASDGASATTAIAGEVAAGAEGDVAPPPAAAVVKKAGGRGKAAAVAAGAAGLATASPAGPASQTAQVARAARAAQDEQLDTARARDYESRLQREIRRTLTTLTGLPEIQAVFLTGSGSRVGGFVEAVSEAFGVKAAPLDLLSRVDHKLGREDVAHFGADIGVALGVAYKLNGMDLTRTDFRREECAYTRKFDQVKSPLIVLSFLLFLVVALGCIDAFYQVKKVEQEYQFLISDAQAQLEELLGDNEKARQLAESAPFGPERMDAIARRISELREETAQQLGRSDIIPPLPSGLHAWIEFSGLVQANEDKLGRLRIKKLDINVYGKNPQIALSGVMESASKYSVLLKIFEDDPLFSSIKQGATTPTDDGMIAFSETVLDIDLEVLAAREKKA